MLDFINTLFHEFHGITAVIMSLFYGISQIASAPAVVAEGADGVGSALELLKDNLASLFGPKE